LDTIIKEIHKANSVLSSGEIRINNTQIHEDKSAILKNAVDYYDRKRTEFFPDHPGEEIAEALRSPDWNTPEEKEEARKIETTTINPVDMRNGSPLDNFVNIKVRYKL
jgi:hypothetical protein